jgi:hypothetical protein
MKKTEEVFTTATKVFEIAETENISTALAANELAEARFLKK